MHTPGPWTSGRAIPADDTVSRIVRAGDDHIAVVMDLDGAAQEAVDNARLIAAAPDLLAALQHMVEMYQRYFNVMPVAWQTADDIACAAIALATGEKQCP